MRTNNRSNPYCFKRLLYLETCDRKTKGRWPKPGQPLRNSHCLKTHTPTQVTFLFHSSMNHVNSGKIWNQNNFIRLPCDQQIGVRYPRSTSPPLQTIQNYGPSDTSDSGQPSAKHSQAEQQEKSTAAACTVSMEFYKKQIFHSVHYIQAASKGDREVLPCN